MGNKASSYISPHTVPKQVPTPPPTIVVDDEWTTEDEAIKQLLEVPEGLHWAQFRQWPTDDEAVAIFYVAGARHVYGYTELRPRGSLG